MSALSKILNIAHLEPSFGNNAQCELHVTQIESDTVRQGERHAAERFARAMELLGDEKLEIRWGGIFALEKMARRSPQDQSEVSEVLATYVRQHGYYKPGEPAGRIASEIQLIVSVLARRIHSASSQDRPLDLHNTNLCKAHLPFGQLDRAFLYNSNLEGALLYQANLQGAWMAHTNLHNANLDYANLNGADLTDAEGMTEEQLRFTQWDKKTTLPKYLSDLSLMSNSRKWRR
jgi:hypothetical protein